MLVRILSGNDRGAVVEMPRTEAESAIASGFCEAVKAPSSASSSRAPAPSSASSSPDADDDPKAPAAGRRKGRHG
jgi:hypothetical protein